VKEVKAAVMLMAVVRATAVVTEKTAAARAVGAPEKAEKAMMVGAMGIVAEKRAVIALEATTARRQERVAAATKAMETAAEKVAGALQPPAVIMSEISMAV
jgi:hypothetical protein